MWKFEDLKMYCVNRLIFNIMKALFIALLLVPCIVYAQKPNYDGVYKTPVPDTKARLKFWDTIRESYTFIADSFRYSFSVMRPNGRGQDVSVEYDEYGIWKIIRTDTEKHKDVAGNENLQYRIYITADDGRMTGYFETPPNPEVQDNMEHGPRNAFYYNKREFFFAEPTRRSLNK